MHRQISPRHEIFRLRNKSDLQTFREETTNTNKFTCCFSQNGDIEKEGKKWMKTLKSTIQKCFKKVRVTKKKKDNIQMQLDLRRKVKTDIINAKTSAERHLLEDKLQHTEEVISAACQAKNYEKIKEQLQSISNKNGTTNCTNVWRLRRKIFPKPAERLTGKKDNKGDLVTNPERLKEIYINAYLERLKHREMTPGLLKLKTLRKALNSSVLYGNADQECLHSLF